MYCAKIAELIEMPFGELTCEPKEPCIRWGRDLPWEGQFYGLSGLLKSIGSLCCDVCNKRDNLIVNNDMQQN